MTTIINTPPSGESSNSGLGIVVGVLVIAVLAALFFIYILPKIGTDNTAPEDNTINVNVELPTNEDASPSPSPSTN